MPPSLPSALAPPLRGNSSTTLNFTITANANHTVAGFFDGALNPNSCMVTLTGTGVLTMQPGNLNGFDLLTSSDASIGQLTINSVIGGGSTGGICAEGSSAVFPERYKYL